MIRHRFTRWLPLAILVGCGGATELETSPSTGGSVISGNGGDDGVGGSGSGNGLGNGASNGIGNGNRGGMSSTGGAVATGGSFPVGGSTGGFPATGGFPVTAGFPSQAGAPSGGSSNQGGSGSEFTPPDQCFLPFDAGPCRGSVAVFAHINGSCTGQTYGGCEGNENRFASLEQCMAVCEGRPFPLGCPEGRVQIESCAECGPAGGCNSFIQICAASCEDSTECGVGSPGCDNGICQGTTCF